jgi:flagellar biosynthesis component FlhA
MLHSSFPIFKCPITHLFLSSVFVNEASHAIMAKVESNQSHGQESSHGFIKQPKYVLKIGKALLVMAEAPGYPTTPMRTRFEDF